MEKAERRKYTDEFKDARQDIVDYIEMFCNSRHRYSSLGYMSPMEFEKQLLRKKAA